MPSAKTSNTKPVKSAQAGPKVHVSQSALDRLKQELSGYVLLPGTPEYALAVQIDNGRVQQQPTVIVQASGEKDVVTTLRFAQQQGLRLTVLGGGHSATGYCLNTGGVVLDMSLMKAMARPISFDRSFKRVRTCACVDTSRPETISSASTKSGFSKAARAYGRAHLETNHDCIRCRSKQYI